MRWVAVLALMGCCLVWGQDIRWAHGEWDESGAPRGKLLSDNAGYWGPSVLTGVTYEYDTPPDNPRDTYRGDRQVFGRRLLDGVMGGDWYVPVGKSYKPLVVTFDFKRPCEFSEVTLYAMRSPKNRVEIQVAESLNPRAWRTVFSHGRVAEDKRAFQRLKLSAGSRGRYMKLTFKSQGDVSWLDEVLVWGEGTISAAYPEDIRPLAVKPVPTGQFQSLRGVKETAFTKASFVAWRQRLGALKSLPVVWASGTESTPGKPVLPAVEEINPRLERTMTRQEMESTYLTVTNPTQKTVTCRLEVRGGHAGVKAELLVGGILPVNRPKRTLTPEETMRLYITDDLPPDAEPDQSFQVLPYFSAKNLLSGNFLRRYVANGASIEGFPRCLVIHPGETVPLMIRFLAADAAPGSSDWTLVATADGDCVSKMRVKLRVLDIDLPDPDAWVRIWGHETKQFPFESKARCQEDVAAVRALGLTVWDGFPEPGSKAEMFARTGKTYYHLMGLPVRLISLGYCSQLKPEAVSDRDRREIASHLNKLMQDARRLNVPFDRWFIEFWDEPGLNNADLYGAFARIVKDLEPQVRIFMNPLFWLPGFPPQQKILDKLKPFYNETIDISCPIQDLLGDNLTTRELWSKPRQVNAFYIHPARRAGRNMVWKAAIHDCNGFGYFCYYAPQGNPWSISTWKALGYAYQMVFPSHAGPVITPIYETMREAWDDYRLLELLRKPQFGTRRQQILREYAAQSPKDFALLRQKIMNVLGK